MIRTSLCLSFALMFAPVLVGCASGKGDTGGGRGKYLTDAKLTSVEVGTKVGAGGKPATTQPDQVDLGRTVYHIRTSDGDFNTSDPDYSALVRPAVKAGDPNAMKQATSVRCEVQFNYPYLSVYDGQSYVTSDKPAAQTEHVIAGSESTVFILEVDHNGKDAPTDWIHRVYVIKCTGNVSCWPQEQITINGNLPTTRVTLVGEGYYVESTLTGGSWKLNAPAKIEDSQARKDTVAAVKQAAIDAGFTVP